MNQINKDLDFWRGAYNILQTTSKWILIWKHSYRLHNSRSYLDELFQFDSLPFDIKSGGAGGKQQVLYSSV